MKSLQAWARRLLLWGPLVIIVGFLIYRGYVGVMTPGTIISRTVIPTTQPDKVYTSVQLKRGPLDVIHYIPGDPSFAERPQAIIVFGSGDGGFTGWEDRVCRALQAEGCEIITLDCFKYSKTDFDLPTLQADMDTLAHAFPHPGLKIPVILGGWSMGADLAVAAAGGPDRPTDLVGLLLISPSARSRYGEREPDRWNVPPTGAGTFALDEFATKLGGLRVAQWDASLDLLDSDTWLKAVSTTHKAYVFKPAFHDYAGASDAFLADLKQTVAWILSND